MQAPTFILKDRRADGTLTYRMVGFNEVYFIDEEGCIAALFNENGGLIKQWVSIDEFRDDYSRECFENDEDMLFAHYQLLIDRRASCYKMPKSLKEDYGVFSNKKIKYWTEVLATYSQHPKFRN